MALRFHLVAVALAAFMCASAAAQAPKAARGRAVQRGVVGTANAGPAPMRPAIEDWILRLADEPPERRRRLLRENEAFRRMTPEERQRILRRLRQIEAMAPEDRARLLERYRRFNQMPPERQASAREAYRRWAALAPERRLLVNRAAARLREMTPEQRARSLESAPFTSRFDEAERNLIGELADLPPPAGPGAR